MISLLCPSRGRPQLAAKMASSAFMKAHGPIEIIFYLNEDDPEFVNDNYKYFFQKSISEKNEDSILGLMVGPDQPTAKSWNDLATLSNGDFLFIMGDDVEFKTEGWDAILLDAAKQYDDGYCVVSMHDGRADDSHPHPGISRKWYEKLGYLAWPGMYHWYVDTWQVTMAKQLGRFVYCPDILVDHQKPAEQGRPDETHARIRRGGINARDKDVWERSQRYMQQDMQILKDAIDG